MPRSSFMILFLGECFRDSHCKEKKKLLPPLERVWNKYRGFFLKLIRQQQQQQPPEAARGKYFSQGDNIQNDDSDDHDEAARVAKMVNQAAAAAAFKDARHLLPFRSTYYSARPKYYLLNYGVKK